MLAAEQSSPDHGAAKVPEYLRRQQHQHSQLDKGALRAEQHQYMDKGALRAEQHWYPAAGGCSSADAAVVAGLQHQGSAAVLVLHRTWRQGLPLPARQSRVLQPAWWQLSPDASALAIPYGNAWTWTPGSVQPGRSGLAFVSCGTVLSSHLVSLPCQAALLASGYPPALCAWSSRKQLLTRQALEGKTVYVVYSAAGQQLATLEACSQEGRLALACAGCWSPNGQVVALLAPAASAAYLWYPRSQQVVPVAIGMDAVSGQEGLSWSPCSGSLLVLAGGRQLALVRDRHLVVLQTCTGMQTAGALAVGGRAAVLRSKLQRGPATELHLLGARLSQTVFFKLPPGSYFVLEPVVSPSGTHVAAVSAETDEQQGSQYQVNFFSFSSRRLLCSWLLDSKPCRVCWVADSQVVVHSQQGYTTLSWG